MQITTVNKNGVKIAVVQSDKVIISSVQSALDFIATVQYRTGSNHITLNKSAICEEFFNLRTKMAGEILQKFVTYQVRLAIIGDFSAYTSKSLQSFIYESNRGRSVFFAADEKQAIEWLSS